MKIGIDARLWNETGVGRYIRNLLTELYSLDKKNDYVIFVTSSNYQSLKKLFPRSNWKIQKADFRWHSFAEQIQFPILLYKERLDLMHFPYYSLPIFYIKPFIVTVHDLIIYHFATGKASTLPWPLYSIKRLGYKLVLYFSVRYSKKIIAPLNVTKDDIAKSLHINLNKIVVTTEGFDQKISDGDVSTKTKELIKNMKYFLYVGNAYPHKNIQELIQGFEKFLDLANDNSVNLILVGKDDYFYKKLRNTYSKNNVIFLNNVTDIDLYYLYQNALSFVSASLMEGFGLAPLEAMGSDCLVSVSNIPSFKEVCGKTAIYFNPKDKMDIAKKLLEVYSMNPKIKEHYIRDGRKRLENFSWVAMAEKTLTLYESCVSI